MVRTNIFRVHAMTLSKFKFYVLAALIAGGIVVLSMIAASLWKDVSIEGSYKHDLSGTSPAPNVESFPSRLHDEYTGEMESDDVTSIHFEHSRSGAIYWQSDDAYDVVVRLWESAIAGEPDAQFYVAMAYWDCLDEHLSKKLAESSSVGQLEDGLCAGVSEEFMSEYSGALSMLSGASEAGYPPAQLWMALRGDSIVKERSNRYIHLSDGDYDKALNSLRAEEELVSGLSLDHDLVYDIANQHGASILPLLSELEFEFPHVSTEEWRDPAMLAAMRYLPCEVGDTCGPGTRLWFMQCGGEAACREDLSLLDNIRMGVDISVYNTLRHGRNRIEEIMKTEKWSDLIDASSD
jgi:hypothetical protein